MLTTNPHENPFAAYMSYREEAEEALRDGNVPVAQLSEDLYRQWFSEGIPIEQVCAAALGINLDDDVDELVGDAPSHRETSETTEGLIVSDVEIQSGTVGHILGWSMPDAPDDREEPDVETEDLL